MAFLFFCGVVLLGCAAALVVRALTLSRVRISSQVRQIETYGFSAGEAPREAGSRPSLAASFTNLARRIGTALNGRGALAQIDPSMLRAAGIYRIDAATFQGYRVIAAAGLPGLLLVELLAAGKAGVGVLFAMSIAGICWVLPQTIVRTRAKKRLAAVDSALPELIDVLTATVEAGLGFAGSLQLVASRFDGPLGEELRLMLQEQSMGLSTEHAMSNLLERCDTPSVRAFARAIMQGESLGVSIGTMLRNLARETRNRRRQAVREQIMKAPVKMLFPLVFLIFPALFLVLLYPALSSVIHSLAAV
jgi:tight adherence protein C